MITLDGTLFRRILLAIAAMVARLFLFMDLLARGMPS